MYMCRDSNYKDDMVLRPIYFYNGIPIHVLVKCYLYIEMAPGDPIADSTCNYNQHNMLFYGDGDDF